eukprot:CAMPEP_0177766354 /NCGR_PEP_ID=MMETSP0491_2-20121128/8481_1 /TAXON_ID=63592 /ORGANISM="Tetraselmis chuii, Strain PLY429" /LENGTH=97 /DNA_ID=CAMNT_0019282765 /DNA_START=784 /DNA_END=1077 /DNA_ORIENTATION=-
MRRLEAHPRDRGQKVASRKDAQRAEHEEVKAAEGDDGAFGDIADDLRRRRGNQRVQQKLLPHPVAVQLEKNPLTAVDDEVTVLSYNGSNAPFPLLHG